jgi:hypothetical protein
LSYFSDRTSHFLHDAGLWPWSSYLCLPKSWNDKYIPPHPANWQRWDFANFLPRLVSNFRLPSLCLLSTWDYSCQLLHPILTLYFKNRNLITSLISTPLRSYSILPMVGKASLFFQTWTENEKTGPPDLSLQPYCIPH